MGGATQAASGAVTKPNVDALIASLAQDRHIYFLATAGVVAIGLLILMASFLPPLATAAGPLSGTLQLGGALLATIAAFPWREVRNCERRTVCLRLLEEEWARISQSDPSSPQLFELRQRILNILEKGAGGG